LYLKLITYNKPRSRAGLRLLEEREPKFDALRTALIEGEQSGIIENFEADSFLEFLNSKDRVNELI